MAKSVIQKAREALSTLESEAHSLGMRSEYRHQLAADIRAGLELSTTPGNGEWVKCSDKMPPDRKAVIVWCYASGCTGYAHYSYQKGEWIMPEPQPAGYNHISHWMPLPQPPVQGGDESE